MLMVRPDRTRSGGGLPPHGSGLDRRALAVAYLAFAAFAGLVAVFSGGDDGIWGAWAACGYAATAAAVWLWQDSLAALVPALTCALAVPLAWLAIRAPVTSDVETVSRSAILLLRHGSPYLPAVRLVSWRSYNPYLPAMAMFGMPKAAGLPGLLGDPRPWLAAASAAALGVAFAMGTPHGAARCVSCRGSMLRYAMLAVASPVCAISLAVGITDPPVLALLCLGLALTARPSRPALAGLAIGAACAMKAIAWPALAVIAAMLAARDGRRAAARFGIASVATAAFGVAAMAPALLTRPSAFFQNTVLFPLGATPQHTPAASPLPGHLLAMTGSAGRIAAIALLIAVALGVAASLVLRPPADTRAATWRLAIGLALFFAFAPAARFGYFAYPGALLGWLVITRRGQVAGNGTVTGGAASQPAPAPATVLEATVAGAADPATNPIAAVPAAARAGPSRAATQAAGTGAAARPAPARRAAMLGPAAARIWRRWRRARRSRPATDSASGGS